MHPFPRFLLETVGTCFIRMRGRERGSLNLQEDARGMGGGRASANFPHCRGPGIDDIYMSISNPGTSV